MGSIGRVAAALVMCVALGTGVAAQETEPAQEAYFRAVGSYFDIARREIAILGDWQLAPDEIPVVLFVARRAGVSAEALVALRQSGRGWADLTNRYGIGSNALYVPIPDDVVPGVLGDLYERLRRTPAAEWPGILLSDGEIVALVNVRVLAEILDLTPVEILAEGESVPTFVELYARLIG